MGEGGGQGPKGPGLTLPLTSSLSPQSTLFCQVERLMELEGQGWGEAIGSQEPHTERELSEGVTRRGARAGSIHLGSRPSPLQLAGGLHSQHQMCVRSSRP